MRTRERTEKGREKKRKRDEERGANERRKRTQNKVAGSRKGTKLHHPTWRRTRVYRAGRRGKVSSFLGSLSDFCTITDATKWKKPMRAVARVVDTSVSVDGLQLGKNRSKHVMMPGMQNVLENKKIWKRRPDGSHLSSFLPSLPFSSSSFSDCLLSSTFSARDVKQHSNQDYPYDYIHEGKQGKEGEMASRTVITELRQDKGRKAEGEEEGTFGARSTFLLINTRKEEIWGIRKEPNDWFFALSNCSK